MNGRLCVSPVTDWLPVQVHPASRPAVAGTGSSPGWCFLPSKNNKFVLQRFIFWDVFSQNKSTCKRNVDERKLRKYIQMKANDDHLSAHSAHRGIDKPPLTMYTKTL